MTKNPIVNALSASAYITLVVGVMNFISQTLGSKPDSAFAPIVFLSLLTLSVSIMTYVFFYQPLLLIIDGKRREAINLLVQTVVVFGVITAVALIFLFLGIM